VNIQIWIGLGLEDGPMSNSVLPRTAYSNGQKIVALYLYYNTIDKNYIGQIIIIIITIVY